VGTFRCPSLESCGEFLAKDMEREIKIHMVNGASSPEIA